MNQYFRAIRDIHPSHLYNFYISDNRHNSLGNGMYFSVNYDFAKIFALNINLKHIAYIGEYQIQIPENSIEISLDELNFELKRELNNYSSILIKDRELCLKCNTKIELIDVSIISRHNEAEEIHNHFKIGDLINDNELKKVPINLLIEIYNFIDKKIKDF